MHAYTGVPTSNMRRDDHSFNAEQHTARTHTKNNPPLPPAIILSPFFSTLPPCFPLPFTIIRGLRQMTVNNGQILGSPSVHTTWGARTQIQG